MRKLFYNGQAILAEPSANSFLVPDNAGDLSSDCQNFGQLASVFSDFAHHGKWDKIIAFSSHLSNVSFSVPFNHDTHLVLALIQRAQIFHFGQPQVPTLFKKFILDSKKVLKNANEISIGQPRMELIAELETRLTLSAYARCQGDYLSAWYHAKKAVNKCSNFHDQKAEAMFALALSLSLIGKTYDALALYERIQKLSNASGYRKMMSRLNEGYERLTLSDTETVKDLLKEIPQEKSFRLHLMFQFLSKGGFSKTEILEALSKKGISAAEKSRYWNYLLESLLLEENVDFEFIRQHFLPLLQSKNVFLNSTFLNMVIELIEEKREPQTLNAEYLQSLRSCLDPKDFLDYFYLRILFQAAQGNDIRDDYQLLDEQLACLKVNDPFLPRLSLLKFSQTMLHKKIAKKLGLFTEKKPCFYFSSTKKTLRFGETVWNLSKNPKTLQLVSYFVGKESPINKQEIHQLMTGSRYVERLHDPRIWMLMKRFRTQIQSQWSLDPITLPGDNKIYLNFIVLSEDES